METKKIVAEAIKEISKEQQEAEVKKIKDIVRVILEKIEERKKREEEIRKERLALEKDLDDLKAGRLDKIEERQGKDPVHDRVTVIEIHKIIEQYIPYQPWRSPYQVTVLPYYSTGTTTVSTMGQTSCTTSSSQASNFLGTMFQNFTAGSYDIGGKIINL